MKERTKFVLEWERLFEKSRGLVNLSELCRAYGISRPTGYTWLDRYRRAGGDVRVLEDRSRRPLSNPNAMTLQVEATLSLHGSFTRAGGQGSSVPGSRIAFLTRRSPRPARSARR